MSFMSSAGFRVSPGNPTQFVCGLAPTPQPYRSGRREAFASLLWVFGLTTLWIQSRTGTSKEAEPTFSWVNGDPAKKQGLARQGKL